MLGLAGKFYVIATILGILQAFSILSWRTYASSKAISTDRLLRSLRALSTFKRVEGPRDDLPMSLRAQRSNLKDHLASAFTMTGHFSTFGGNDEKA